MSCCVELVKLKKGGTSPEDVNLMCSGVALVKTDAECDQFRQGYAASFESAEKPVPDTCK